MKTSHPPIRRMIYIDQRLRDKKYPNCNKIAGVFEVHPKTIHRDIEYMRYQLDAPIEFDKKKNGYYYSQPDYFLPSIHISDRDILSFIVNERILNQYKNTPYYDDIKKIIKKIMHYLPDQSFDNDIGDFISFQQFPKSPVVKHKIEIIQQAILAAKQIKIRYHSLYRDEHTERTVDPYLLHNHYGAWYLISFCHLRNEYRMFGLNRILTIENTEVEFVKPSDFSIENLLKDSFDLIWGGETYHIKLKFTPYKSRWIRERKWHHSQQLTELDDGGLLLEMDVQGLDDVKQWVMQYGAEVEVLEPDLLREKILGEIKRMSILYDVPG